jgi:hypothetical protein
MVLQLVKRVLAICTVPVELEFRHSWAPATAVEI